RWSRSTARCWMQKQRRLTRPCGRACRDCCTSWQRLYGTRLRPIRGACRHRLADTAIPELLRRLPARRRWFAIALRHCVQQPGPERADGRLGHVLWQIDQVVRGTLGEAVRDRGDQPAARKLIGGEGTADQDDALSGGRGLDADRGVLQQRPAFPIDVEPL